MVKSFSKLYSAIGIKFPKKLVEHTVALLAYSGSQENEVEWLGARTLIVFLFSLAGTLAFVLLQRTAELYAVALFFIFLNLVITFLSYLIIYYRASARATSVEKVLPDFLMLMVSNLHAGMTPFSSFVRAARPEFGPLYNEILIASSRVGGKRTLEDSMSYLASRFNSEIFRKSIDTFVSGSKSGAHLAKLLTVNAEEIRKLQDLRQELISATKSYAMFLAFIVAVLMPFLLGISLNFLTTFLTIQKQSKFSESFSSTVSLGFFNGEISILPDEMFMIAILALVMTTFFTSLFMGIVMSGKPLLGLKYFPIILGFAVGFFYFTRLVMASVNSIG
ncbi:MAG: type II secretion system F family protein [Thaumarchaeota archaeon]|nr:type II secretion system F family protein [Nitrososphaerota archaeon]